MLKNNKIMISASETFALFTHLHIIGDSVVLKHHEHHELEKNIFMNKKLHAEDVLRHRLSQYNEAHGVSLPRLGLRFE